MDNNISIFTADWIITINNEIIKNGFIHCSNDGTILKITNKHTDNKNIKKLDGVICPGFINSHCHLELSHLKGKLTKHKGLVNFIKEIQKFRNSDNDIIDLAINAAEQEMIKNGIVAVGDISNSDKTFNAKKLNNLKYYNFIEVFGFNPLSADNVFEQATLLKEKIENSSITPHAPYSVSDKLFSLIKDQQPDKITIHNQESEQENIFFKNKEGDFCSLYQTFGLDISFFNNTNKTSLLSVADKLPNSKRLLVHNTFTSDDDIKEYNKTINNTYWCLCPKANLFIENKLPDIELLMKHNAKIVFGTDGLSSNDNLSILEEMKCFKNIELEKLLTFACKNAAEFFNWTDLGSIEIGKKPGLNLLTNIEIINDQLYLTNNTEVKKII